MFSLLFKSTPREMSFQHGLAVATLTPIVVIALLVLMGLTFCCYKKLKRNISLPVLRASVSRVAPVDQNTSLPSYDEAIQLPPDYSPPDVFTIAWNQLNHGLIYCRKKRSYTFFCNNLMYRFSLIWYCFSICFSSIFLRHTIIATITVTAADVKHLTDKNDYQIHSHVNHWSIHKKFTKQLRRQ